MAAATDPGSSGRVIPALPPERTRGGGDRSTRGGEPELAGKLRLVVEELGEHAIILKIGDRIDATVSRQARRLARAFTSQPLPGLLDVVPAFASVALHFGADARIPRSRARAQAIAALAEPDARESGDAQSPRRVTLPVSYGGEDGIDLEALARHAALDPDEVVRRHTACEYEVAMLGFLPGFAYLLGLDPALAMNRHATPRAQVPAGSVAIGGAQTGIYPCEAPGGWQLVGRTDVRLFDAAAAPPTMLEPGDRVRFLAV